MTNFWITSCFFEAVQEGSQEGKDRDAQGEAFRKSQAEGNGQGQG